MTIALACSGTASWWWFGIRLESGVSRGAAGHDPPSCQPQGALLISDESLLPHSFFPVELSLSRLNPWLPRGQANTEVMQGTTEFHDQIADTLCPQTDPVFDDATALDTTVDMLNAEPALVQGLVGELLLPRELLATGFLRRHKDLDLGQREGQKAQILQQPTARR